VKANRILHATRLVHFTSTKNPSYIFTSKSLYRAENQTRRGNRYQTYDIQGQIQAKDGPLPFANIWIKNLKKGWMRICTPHKFAIIIPKQKVSLNLFIN